MTDGTTWPEVLHRLLAGQDLSADEAAWAMDQVMTGQAAPAQLAGFLIGLRAKGESVSEMRGLADMMLAHAHRFEVDGPSLDIVGTGGDRSHTVNISSMSCIVAAAAGVPVVKHGNRAASSSSGSADMLEALGVRLDLTPEQVAATHARCGITFCFAQTFHPSMRHAGAVRRELGVATVFNFLGPLTNPAGATRQLLGVSDPRYQETIAEALVALGCERAFVVHSDDGLDEIGLEGPTRVIEVRDGKTEEWYADPAELGLGRADHAEIAGGSPEENAAVVRAVLTGEDRGPARDVVLANAGAAIVVGGGAEDLREGVERAREAIDGGRARDVLEDLIDLSRKLASEAR